MTLWLCAQNRPYLARSYLCCGIPIFNQCSLSLSVRARLDPQTGMQ